MGPYYQAFPEGGSIKIFADDAKRNYEEIAKWSKKDAEAMPKWDAWIAGLADVLGPLLLTVPPNIGSRKPADLKDTLRLAWRQRGLDVRTVADVTRLMTMSIADLLDDWFESWQVKAPIAVNGVIGTWAGPCEPGTAYVMAHHSIGDIGDGHLGNWGFPEGGMGAVADAIERSARSFGAEIRTDARVDRTLVLERPGPGRGARERRGDPGPGGGDHAPSPARPSSTTSPAASCPTTSSRTSSAGRPAAGWSRSTWPCPSSPTSPPTPVPSWPSTTPARWRWPRRSSTWSGPSRTPGRAGPPSGRSATA